MKPDISAVLADIAARLIGEIAPNVQPAYLAGTVGLSAGLLHAVNEEFDRAGRRRVEENAAIRALFAQAAALDLPVVLAERLRALATSEDTDLRVNALEAANADLRAALIDLQVAIEVRRDPQALALNDAIWAELAVSTGRRKLAAGNF